MLAYMLLRTRGTGLYRDGVDFAAISVLLGHADMKTTRDHYEGSLHNAFTGTTERDCKQKNRYYNGRTAVMTR